MGAGTGQTANKFGMSLVFIIGLLSSCGASDLGTCIIMKSGDDIVIENISIEECQQRFLEEPGARGLEWRPNS